MQRQLFYDEDGNAVEFIVKAKFSINEIDYVAMVPVDDIEPLVYILKIDLDDNGNEILLGIDDDELEEAIEVYEELIKDKLQ
ncbi:Protein of unknown function [Anaerosphaera aminiphila DSM 21120]|uniref:DUF1292 domain-containing protein n=1 Tax=Anaerosphaera aminiphila DSM 21120 TaxID=1120995 RepID=A0A1M5NNH8_9FIRM|nr:DUF1292 domain-containing protein [Anaerosphaera aminiphila]SHG91106.1 Protein of unknown function [Anaerosphaera aminiphila DSM 21120]